MGVPYHDTNSMMTSVIRQYRSHDLSTQDSAALMDRVDIKYVLPVDLMLHCLQQMADQYTLLEIGGHRLFRYDSLYLDNEALDFYRAHHSGKLNRHKVRLRHYREARRLFLEVKLKNNRKRTLKERVELTNGQCETGEASKFLRSLVPVSPRHLTPSLFVGYRRMTLLNGDRTERVTVDTDLQFRSYRNGQWATLPGIAVIEVKAGRKAHEAAMYTMLKENTVRPLRLSKYCTGIALTENVRTNGFKPLLTQLTRISRRQSQ